MFNLIAASLVVSRIIRAGIVSVLGLIRIRGSFIAVALAVKILSNIVVSFLSFI